MMSNAETITRLAPAPALAERMLLVQGRQVHYLEAGSGPPLIWLPSTFLGAWAYAPAIQALAGSFRVVAPDLPGAGRSQGGRRLWDYGRLADWVPTFLNELGLSRVILAGHSDAGAVVVRAAARYGRRFAGVILVNSVGARPEAGVFRLLAGRIRDSLTEEFRLNFQLGPPLLGNLVRHPRNFAYHALWLAPEPEALARAPRVKLPALVAWGRRDHTFPPECAERWHAALPQSQLVWSDGSHDWPITHPHDLAAAAEQFARDLGALGPEPATWERPPEPA